MPPYWLSAGLAFQIRSLVQLPHRHRRAPLMPKQALLIRSPELPESFSLMISRLFPFVKCLRYVRLQSLREQSSSQFSASLFLGELQGELYFPFEVGRTSAGNVFKVFPATADQI